MIYVMSDIHGRGDRFDSLLRRIDLKPEDHLYVLGDVVDRNEGGIALIFRLTDMPNATLLIGNHEKMMRDCLLHDEDCTNWIHNGGMITLQEYFSLPPAKMLRLQKIIEALPVEKSVEVNGEEYILVHAAPLPEGCRESYDETMLEAAVWTRLNPEEAVCTDGTLIFGHTPTIYYQEGMPLRVWYGNHRIDIDCGCSAEEGRLACLRLDDGKVFYSDEE